MGLQQYVIDNNDLCKIWCLSFKTPILLLEVRRGLRCLSSRFMRLLMFYVNQIKNHVAENIHSKCSMLHEYCCWMFWQEDSTYYRRGRAKSKYTIVSYLERLLSKTDGCQDYSTVCKRFCIYCVLMFWSCTLEQRCLLAPAAFSSLLARWHPLLDIDLPFLFPQVCVILIHATPTDLLIYVHLILKANILNNIAIFTSN